MKTMLKEYLEERHDVLYTKTIEHSTGIFMWGVMFGIVLYCTYLAPLFIGMLVGFSIAKKDIPIVNYVISKALGIINGSASTLISGPSRLLISGSENNGIINQLNPVVVQPAQ